jgi:hypothetical protein
VSFEVPYSMSPKLGLRYCELPLFTIRSPSGDTFDAEISDIIRRGALGDADPTISDRDSGSRECGP